MYVPNMSLMSNIGERSASGDYLSPWELDDRRGGLMTASCRGAWVMDERARERERGGNKEGV